MLKLIQRVKKTGHSFHSRSQICFILSFQACLLNFTYGCQIIFSKPMLKMEKQAILILKIIFDHGIKNQLQGTAELLFKALKIYFLI